jgi:hypothetical protein
MASGLGDEVGDSIVSRRQAGRMRRGVGFVDSGVPEFAENLSVGSSPFVLGDRAREELGRRFRANEPVLIKARCSAEVLEALEESWVRFVCNDARRDYVVNPAESDIGPGVESQHARGGLSLRQVWYGCHRLEAQLGRKLRGRRGPDGNPVREWLESSDVEVVSAARELVEVLRELGVSLCGEETEVLCPSFVLGSVHARGGGPTHYDTYHSWATVLVGRKTFYVLPSEALASTYSLRKL